MKEYINSYAKINLFLDIISKREDNYHLIESLFSTIDLHDKIEIEEADNYSIETKGKYKIDDSEENIVTRVFIYFKKNLYLKKNYKITIEKNIPTGAGLAGGSSNASEIIKFLNTKIVNPLDKEELKKLAVNFGADVPFFIEGGTQWAGGIGEKLEILNIKLPYSLILIYPKIHISTKEAYKRFNSSMFSKGNFNLLKDIIKNSPEKIYDLDKLEKYLYNIFEKNVFSLKKEIENCKNTVSQITKKPVHMSGSGSSLFILYDTQKKEEIKKIESDIKKINDSGVEELKDIDIYLSRFYLERVNL